MSKFEHLHRAIVARILEGPGEASLEQRRAAFANAGSGAQASALVEKVAMHAAEITDEDFRVARESGLPDDQIFEVVVSAAVGQASRQYEAALAALRSTIGRAHTSTNS